MYNAQGATPQVRLSSMIPLPYTLSRPAALWLCPSQSVLRNPVQSSNFVCLVYREGLPPIQEFAVLSGHCTGKACQKRTSCQQGEGNLF